MAAVQANGSTDGRGLAFVLYGLAIAGFARRAKQDGDELAAWLATAAVLAAAARVHYILYPSHIYEALPDTAVVMLTVSRNDDDLFDALRVGAVGYLLKDIDHERLPQALREILSGEAVLSRGC